MYLTESIKKPMESGRVLSYCQKILENIPKKWLHLTTHRLDRYDEPLAKTQFLDRFEALFCANDSTLSSLKGLPTAYDYIRLGHPLSCILEWTLAKLKGLSSENVISFSSRMLPILAILRKNAITGKHTRILYTDQLPSFFDPEILRRVYGYRFELKKVRQESSPSKFNGSTIAILQKQNFGCLDLTPSADFYIHMHDSLGCIVYINSDQNRGYISEIQHVRRRETIAMTPANSLLALYGITEKSSGYQNHLDGASNKEIVLNAIKKITGTTVEPLLASSGLSMQYAIVMGLIHNAQEQYPAKAIKIIIPTNCYGGTNDQARRIADTIDKVGIIDLLVDDGSHMEQHIDRILTKTALDDCVPLIIAEIPTNPRVQIPNLEVLQSVLGEKRRTSTGEKAVDPIFILDQTFCPNVQFFGVNQLLSSVKGIAYVSGSKFPSGGQCTAGYCVANSKSEDLMANIALHLHLCDNEAEPLQMEILSKQLPSMNRRIDQAYQNARKFVDFIRCTLPDVAINFVSKELAAQGFKPSVFSLDLPTPEIEAQKRELFKRRLHHQLINTMITTDPSQSKFCVSYGQLKGSYWTIPAISTQGTTKESDKDYIVRIAVSPELDLELHKQAFSTFVRKFLPSCIKA